ncbi:MAG TPA: OmpA family protein, partial [Gemmatimonadales bacterium]|nr:OmpA family protein [Gemmatimonadales bacterium]
LRVEGRAIYTPSTQATFGSSTATHLVGSVGLSVFHLGALPPAAPPPPTVLAQKAVKCPNPPPGAILDAEGCPIDSDGDGVPDGIDQCPNTPKGAVVDAKGCPIDSDGDGVPDGIDQCPNTPPGTKVDAVGCPLKVEAVAPPPPPPDTQPKAAPPPPAPAPKCPPPPPGSVVDENGCLVLFTPDAVRSPAPGAPPRPTLILRGVNFETGRSTLTRDSYLVLDAVAASLVANPEIRIEVAGYTDSTGRKYPNLRLSQARAAAVRFYLARKGVLPARMVAKGYGASNYLVPNATADGRAQNRRVELHKLP